MTPVDSTVVIQAIIAAIVTLILALLQRKTQRVIQDGTIQARVASERAARHVEDVKIALSTRVAAADEKLDTIHALVNSAMAKQLKIAAVALRRLAASGDPKDVEAAELAEALYEEHMARQARADAKE